MLERIADELRSNGFAPRVVEFANSPSPCHAIIFDIEVPVGRHKDKMLTLALSFQDGAYPEYPPHFVYFKSSVDSGKFTTHFILQFEGVTWFAYSLPPNDFWDTLEASQKNMNTYVKRHLYRILAEL